MSETVQETPAGVPPLCVYFVPSVCIATALTQSRVAAADATASHAHASAPSPKHNVVKSAGMCQYCRVTVQCAALKTEAAPAICNTSVPAAGRAAKLRQTATLEFPVVRQPLLLRSQQRQLSIPAMSAVHKVLCRNTHQGRRRFSIWRMELQELLYIQA